MKEDHVYYEKVRQAIEAKDRGTLQNLTSLIHKSICNCTNKKEIGELSQISRMAQNHIRLLNTRISHG